MARFSPRRGFESRAAHKGMAPVATTIAIRTSFWITRGRPLFDDDGVTALEREPPGSALGVQEHVEREANTHRAGRRRCPQHEDTVAMPVLGHAAGAGEGLKHIATRLEGIDARAAHLTDDR